MLLFSPAASAQPAPWAVTIDQAQKAATRGSYFLLGTQPQLALTFRVGYDEKIRSHGLDWFRERMQVDVLRDGNPVPVRISALQDRSYNSADETVSMRVAIERRDGEPFVPGDYHIAIDLSSILAFVRSDSRSLAPGPPPTQTARFLIQDVVTREQEIEFHNREGSRQRAAGNTTAAIRHFQESLRAEPDQFQALSALGVLYVSAKQYREAIPLLERALPWYLKLREQRGGVPQVLAAAYLAVGRDADAAKVLRSVGYTDRAITERIERLRLEHAK